jgi:hypothetical protein
MQSPSKIHFGEGKIILRYVHGTKNLAFGIIQQIVFGWLVLQIVIGLVVLMIEKVLHVMFSSKDQV